MQEVVIMVSSQEQSKEAAEILVAAVKAVVQDKITAQTASISASLTESIDCT